MLLILTYHRITEAGGDFYDVTPAGLSRQIDALEAHGFTPTPASLRAGENFAPGGCVLTFDDGTSDHFETAAPLLERRGWRGLFFVPTDYLGRAGHVTREQARELTARGHVVACHSHEHVRLDLLPEGCVSEQLSRAKAELRAATGGDARWFAPPGGFVNATVRQVARDLGFTALRTMEWGVNRTVRGDRLQCIPLNRRIDAERFTRIIQGHGLKRLRAMYFAKQGIKRLVPMKVYRSFRDAVLARGNGGG